MTSYVFANLPRNLHSNVRAAFAKRDAKTIAAIYAQNKVVTCSSCLDDADVLVWTKHAIDNDIITDGKPKIIGKTS